jgi:hypothetical protein
MGKTYTYFIAAVGVVCAYFLVRLVFFTELSTRTVQSDVVQGILIGAGLALVTAQVYGRLRGTRTNGWLTMRGCGLPGNGMFLRAAQAWVFTGPIASPQEAMYWWANSDGDGRRLSGEHRYVMHFPHGGLPPNAGFWSLTMGDAGNRYVPNALQRYHVGDRSGLVPNDDGSVDVFLQTTAPAGREANWLPAPEGGFILWFRVYVPGPAVLDGTYTVPPVARTGERTGGR